MKILENGAAIFMVAFLLVNVYGLFRLELEALKKKD